MINSGTLSRSTNSRMTGAVVLKRSDKLDPPVLEELINLLEDGCVSVVVPGRSVEYKRLVCTFDNMVGAS